MKRQNQINNDPKTKQLIQAFVDEILKYNKAHNIVGRHSQSEIISLDIIDCETILEHIQPSQTILDIGSGAGLPGLVIAIKTPSSKVTMFEKNKKKAYFIKKNYTHTPSQKRKDSGQGNNTRANDRHAV